MNYFSYGVGVGQLTKPEKIFLNNTNMAHALSNGRSDIGASRETFFANQLDGLHTLHLTEKGDFLVDGNVVVEIGGRNKTRKQVADNPSALLLKDDIEIGADRIIPLWMFGFLY
jgi:predicted AAA+ superfamily ATPase